MRTTLRGVVLGIVLTAAAAGAQTSPPQPSSGPGGSDYAHGSYGVTTNGSGALQYWVYAPAAPAPATAPVIVFLHGANVLTPDPYLPWIEHLVRRGNLVVYPKFQANVLTLPSTYTASAITAIQNALAWLAATPSHVRPDLARFALVGHSYGGLVSVNIANRWASIGLPQPKALMPVEPWYDNMDPTLDGIPATVLMNCVVGADDALAGAQGCDLVWAKTAHVPAANRDFVTLRSDAHGPVALQATHVAPTGNVLDALDWYGLWKTLDGLTDCAFFGTHCAYGLEDTPEHRDMGTWSDGVPVVPLLVTDGDSRCGNGSVDAAAGEQCDVALAGVCCGRDCRFAATTVACRAATGPCDVVETCGGAAATCPTDAFASASVVCRPGSGDACDPDETCTGDAASCPADVVTDAGTVCRPGSGDACDPAEACTGLAGTPCPSDAVAPPTTPCRAAAGPCDVAESCDGVSPACPADGFATGGVCRASTGECDVAETCAGTSATCPTDGFATGGVCRPAAGDCDVAESCTGVSASCPADAFATGSVCRASTGDCDVAETCSGTSSTCPADTGLPDGDADGTCDAQDRCPTVPDPTQLDGDADGLGDACDPCTNLVPTTVAKPTLALTKVAPPTGDDRLSLTATIGAVPTSPPLDPLAHGFRLLVTGTDGSVVVDAVIPGGLWTTSTRAGWSSGGSAFTYKNAGRTVPLVAGIVKVVLKRVSSGLKVTVKAKDGAYSIADGALPLTTTVVLTPPLAATGQCAEIASACTISGADATVKCR